MACDLLPATSQHAPCPCKIDFINIILHTLWNYKSVPKCRNIITDKMTLWMTMHIPTLPPAHTYVAIFDWIVLSCYARFHPLEWCQTFQHTYKRTTSWPLQPPEDFNAEDFEFFLDGEVPVLDITKHPLPTVASVRIWWGRQKNKQNSEKIAFFRDVINPRLCPVVATIRIIQQARSLNSNSGLP